jgi:molecular chaperone DnaK
MSGASERAFYLGIDLGTTNSAAAVFDGEKVEMVRNAAGNTLTPSVVRIDAKGSVTVGARARRLLESDARNTRAEFKRLMGTAQRLSFAAAHAEKKPEELAAAVLSALRADVKEQLGFLPERAVISVPALFELPQSAATTEAARLAGFTKVELIQEPVASALAAGWTADEGAGRWLVYDLGGGTFDASLLETEGGMLRVVGHDGDNFLGGRDFDWAVVDWVLAGLLESRGVRIGRGDAEHAAGIRQLKLAVEEAKIELTRATEATLSVPEAFSVGGEPVDVEVTLDRATLDRLCEPLVERTIAVCQRLLQAHGAAEPGKLSRVVLVGGPTVMPVVRERLRAALGTPFGEGLDPMTLVAQGAALYALTAGLEARPAKRDEGVGQRVWLQFPAMTSDLTPHVVGKLVGSTSAERVASVRLARSDGLWEGTPAAIDAEGAFATSVELLPRRPNVFRLEGTSAAGARVPLWPTTLTIVQGLTIDDPPLSRTIGVALASDQVRVYFERGSPLPARRTFVHHTVESVARGSGDFVLKIPIVQGELDHAHLCRLVGTLEIPASGVTSTVAAGAAVEVTLDLDRGGHLSARALLPATSQVFEQVAHLLVPDADPDVLEASAAAMRDRVSSLRADAFRRGAGKAVERLARAEGDLAAVARDISAARGGDADAAQKARRTLLDLDGELEVVELEKRWPELEQRAQREVATALRWVSRHGTAAEQQLLNELCGQVEKARAARDPVELARQLRVVDDLSDAAFYRDPDVWPMLFESAASRADQATDLVAASRLVGDGRAAMERRDTAALRPIVEALWKVLPADARQRRLGFDSGVR